MLRIGIVGMGFGAAVHLPVFASLPGVAVTALADGGSGRAQRAAAHMADPPRAFGDGAELAACGEVDAVVVACPPGSQKRVVMAAIAAGRAVLCEKPSGLSVEEAEKMTSAAARAEVVNAVNFEFRFEPGIRELIQQIRHGAVGRAQRIAVTWLTCGGADLSRPWSWKHDKSQGGGIATEFCSHVFDYAEQIVGTPIESVFANCRILVPSRPNKSGTPRPVTAEDCCDLVCTFACGVIGQFSVSNCYPAGGGHRIEVLGTHGRLLFNHRPSFPPDRAFLELEPVLKAPRRIALDMPETGLSGDSRLESVRRLAALFVDAALERPAPDLPGFDAGLRARRVIAAVERSAAEHRIVDVAQP